MTSSISSLLMVIGLWLTLAFFCCGDSVRKKSLTAGERAKALRTKEKACETVERLKTAGAFTKIESGYSGVTHAYVGAGFFQVPVDEKKQTIEWVALCNISLEEKDQLGIVIIHNGFSGKRIGTFDFASGLNLE